MKVGNHFRLSARSWPFASVYLPNRASAMRTATDITSAVMQTARRAPRRRWSPRLSITRQCEGLATLLENLDQRAERVFRVEVEVLE